MQVYLQHTTEDARQQYRAYRIIRAEEGIIEGVGEQGITLYLERCNDSAKATSHPIVGAQRVQEFFKEAKVTNANGLEGRVVLGLIDPTDAVIGISLGQE